MVSKTICIRKKNIYTYAFILLLVFLFLGYLIYRRYIETYKIDYVSDYYILNPITWFQTQDANNQINKDEQKTKEKNTCPIDLADCNQNILKLKNEITQRELLEKQCQKELFALKQTRQQSGDTYTSLSRNTSGQLISPNRQYINPNDPNVYNSGIYQMVGYVYDSTIRYPLYGRYKDPGRSDRWEYYVMDETRNRLKIPFNTSNYKELYDGDTVNIPSLGNFTVSIYEIETVRYDPNVY